MNTRTRMLPFLLALMAAGPAFGQDAIDQAQNKILAKRAAEADAYRKLAEAVYGLQINSDTTVRDFVTESDDIRSRVDTFVKGIRLGTPHYYEDGVAEVDAEVTVAKVIETLQEAHKEHYRGKHVTASDFLSMQRRIEKNVLRATGMGAPRPDLPPDLPMGAEDLLPPLPPQYAGGRMSVPANWRAVGPQARLMAMQAARRDAQRQLLEYIKGLRLTSDSLVRDFVTEYDEIRTSARGLVVGSIETHRYLHDDELIAEVTMEVPIKKVITTLTEIYRSHDKGNRVRTSDITNLEKTVKRKVISATGMGVPPRRLIRKPTATQQQSSIQPPDWMFSEIRVIGEATDDELNTAQGKLRARRAAELDALRKLAERVYGLEVSSNTSIRDFVAEYDQIESQLQGVLAGAYVLDEQYADGVARVTVALSGAELWNVMVDQLQSNQRHG